MGTRVTASPSRRAAATSCAWRPIGSLAPLVVGLTLEQIEADLGAFWERLVGDGQLRWVGPEKGVMHLATAAIVNAVWDLLAKRAGKPLWSYLAEMSPEALVRAVPFRHITDALTPGEALDILRRLEASAPCARPSSARRATPPTPPRAAGSATPTTRCAASRVPAWRRAGRTSSSRSGWTSRTMCGAPPSCARRSATTAS